ncbi:alpha/beta hydrolase [Acidisoma sp.]|uniref:alpha/beta hydrolase n=1 Tax=Acidisoma sp. TaxID=1872115 RepID=UPI003B007A15
MSTDNFGGGKTLTRDSAQNSPYVSTERPHVALGRRTLSSAGLGALSLLATACSPLGLLNGLAPKRLSARNIPYGAGPRRKLDVYAPDSARGPAPVVVFLYGGSWDSGSKDDYRFVGGALAAAGFVTVIPDYRLYPEVVFPAFLEDCATAVAWACAHSADYGGGNSVVLMGHSAGAYNAAMLALDPSYLAQAGARHPLAGTVGIAGPYDFLPVQSAELKAIFGQPPTPPATQPIDHVDGRNAPMLLLAGATDTTVLPQNTVRLAARIRAAGGPVQSRIYPGIDHKEIIGAMGVPFRFLCPTYRNCIQFVSDHASTGAQAA